MILYYFNNEDYHIEKVEIVIDGLSYDWKRYKAILKSEIRSDKSKNYINVSKKEGEVCYNNFWLEKEDDDRAMNIYKKYMNQKKELAKKRFEKLMRA